MLGHGGAGWGWRLAIAATQKQLANALEALAAAIDLGADLSDWPEHRDQQDLTPW